jgi:predicted neutral ceramidase superfamily lipid hydrolase
MKYLAFRPKTNNPPDENHPMRNIKGLFVLPNVHFGPFKTAGSAALPETIYSKFGDIQGLTVFHTSVTHGENFASRQSNALVCKQIEEDMSQFLFKTPKISKFHRTLHGQTKILGFVTEKTPYIFATRHPFPTDDIMPGVGESIKKRSNDNQLASPFFVDCHNAIIGDEILITENSKEGNELIDASEQFFKNIKNQSTFSEVQYGCAKTKVPFPIDAGIGSGGIVCHFFKIDKQKNVLIHVDSNNALISVRNQIVDLSQKKGIDCIELTTSDTHNVVRVISSRGYHPLGEKVKLNYLIPEIDKLIDEAERNAEPVEIAEFESETPNYYFWPNIEYFDLIILTIQRCLTVSKFLLTIGLAFPMVFAFLLITFLYGNVLPISPI